MNLLEKHCARCNTTKMAAEFYSNAARNTGLSDWCKKCNDEYTLDAAYARRRAEGRVAKDVSPVDTSADGVLCKKCRNRFPVEEMATSKDQSGQSRLRGQCKQCFNEYHRIYRRRND